MPQSEPDFFELLKDARESAVHLEMRDAYGVGDESEDFDRWKESGKRDSDPGSPYWAPWVSVISETVARGVTVRRARIVSEPVTDYIRWEHAGTAVNITAGEEVRWLPRRLASGIALPGNDFWIFDSETVLFNHFTGSGDWAGQELTTDPGVARLCASAFAAVWDSGIPHDAYHV
ncbi:hypothetical protein OG401_19420 [Kitasatospora purpeofusca]|uniref:DUF6879 family protein n=1 Tax=Kitasatospora TaxID=2063 RepID=UPI00225B6F58|nr:DUF6879 family protein [Kitasatospora purpeofusca]MCX4686453.1 hypothetical protein [Kitasatospora purpeofusca]